MIFETIFCKKITFHLHPHDVNNVSYKMELSLVLITMDIYAFIQYTYVQKSNRIRIKKVENIVIPYSFNHAH